ncbi:hypothetical protein [Nitrospirillum sp. BR 11828]|uniref:hypothetical protein n=1 Tax=Nitrospirillum sp. BR 11828 TaxID=3104325 RepID=UPI002ACAC957|nr:hypothetical protein [Nitrospirillum sp. BR 11828]MDZ5648950.1 hypothetical protein [Nitrospirillum sp. BR 11828]
MSADLAGAIQKLMVAGAMPLLHCEQNKKTSELWPCIQAARSAKLSQPNTLIKSGKIIAGSSVDLGFFISDLYIADEEFGCISAIKLKATLHPACARWSIEGDLDLIDVEMKMVDMNEKDLLDLMQIKRPIISEMRAAYGKK